ncbi:transposase [Kocuria atrinae]|uniref:transposase n=1 Tax=Kocuria atrinae TaxID=592377 RepID=UPI0037C10419
MLLNISDGTAFETAGHHAACASIALDTRRYGTSSRGEIPARSDSERLKNTLFDSAWVASNHYPISKAYYDRKRAEGKRRNTAVIWLTHRCCNVICAMPRDGTHYQPPAPTPATESATLAA